VKLADVEIDPADVVHGRAPGDRPTSASMTPAPAHQPASRLDDGLREIVAVSLAIGDKVLIEATGAYTATYSLGRLQRLSRRCGSM